MHTWRTNHIPSSFHPDDDGDFYDDLPAGPLEIVLHLGDGRELVQRVDVAPGSAVECVFEE